jgi:hypothetical protein
LTLVKKCQRSNVDPQFDPQIKDMYNNNYIDQDLMYLADAYIDDDAFNSFFGSSVLEMAKFYMDVYCDCIIGSSGIIKQIGNDFGMLLISKSHEL